MIDIIDRVESLAQTITYVVVSFINALIIIISDDVVEIHFKTELKQN
jgi:hypothetical protein